MRQFILVLVDGKTLQASGHNIVDALWRSGSDHTDLKQVAAYQEEGCLVVRFAS